jgi:hypothetical protein
MVAPAVIVAANVEERREDHEIFAPTIVSVRFSELPP